MRDTLRGVLLVVSMLVLPRESYAQGDASRDTTPARHSVPTIALSFAVGASIAAAFDGGWQRTISGPGPQSSTPLRDAARLGNTWGSPGAIVAAGALWLGARVLHDSTRAKLGGRALEALALSGIITGGVKGIAGRARPYADPGHPEDWALARGIRNGSYQSFPSGHATAAFAVASAITAELQRDRSPIARWAGPALYTLAAVTAFGRTYYNKHWLSDVVAGAGVGTVSGLIVVRWHADHPRSWIDGLLLGR
ncbi:MAG: phosphatase PAP2 family protein [Gemmatimonadaceae bacterium]